MAPVSVPSSLSLEDIWRFQSYTGYLALNAAVVFGVVLWDYIQLLPEERSLYEKRRRREWRSPAPWAFIALRYSALASTFCGMLYSSLRLSDCQPAVSVGQGATVVVVASSGIIFSSRIGSLWDYQRLPLAMVFIPCIVMVCSWMAFAAQFRATVGLALPFGTNCQFVPLAEWTPISYASTAAFNCVVLGLAITRVFTKCTMVATNTGFTLINRACILYLLCAAIPSIAIVCVYSVNWPTELIKQVSGPYSILIMMSMGSRVFLNLQLHNHILTRVAESNHFTSPNWTPGNPEKVISSPKPSNAHEPDFEPSITMLSVPESDVLSLDRYTTRTNLTVPETPATVTSFSESSTYSGSSYGRVMSSSRSTPGSTRSHTRGGSMKSSSSGSTRHTDSSPRTPRSARMGSVRSVGTTSTRHTDVSTRTPRSARVGSVRSVGTTSTRQTTPRSPKRVRMASFNSFATEATKLPTENLKSTWHGV